MSFVLIRGVQALTAAGAGLGMFEYLQMADELNAIPIWVANNGVAHQVQLASGCPLHLELQQPPAALYSPDNVSLNLPVQHVTGQRWQDDCTHGIPATPAMHATRQSCSSWRQA